VSPFPLVSLAIAVGAALLAWRQRGDFAAHPWSHWFVYLNLAAVGLHQFEEYGWPGGFRDAFVAVFGDPAAAAVVPPSGVLAAGNAFGFTLLFGALGLLGTRVVWIGVATLSIHAANGLFHLGWSASHGTYVPGAVTGTLLYLPLAILAARFALARGAVGPGRLALAAGTGAIVSLAPFAHVLLAIALR
jgi:hypothetical protein